MSLYELNKIVSRAAKALYDNEKFVVGVLAVRARKASEAYPSDPTVVAMSNFLTKRASANEFITRSEFKDIYNRLYSQNNHFGGLFSEELGVTELLKSQVTKRTASEGEDFTKAYEKIADPILSNALGSIFSKNASYKPYSASMAKSAERTCLHELNRYAAPRKIDVVAGQEDLLICQATYDTPKGCTSVLVPVEVSKDGIVLLPTVFLTQAGFVDLTKESLEDHIASTAGKNFSVDVQQILQVVANAKNGVPEPLSEMEIIIAKTKVANGEISTHTANGILYQEVDKVQLEVATPRLAEADSFEKNLASPVGIAEFTFGKMAVDVGRKMLKQALSNFGYSQANIAVSDVNSGTIFFAVSVDNKIGFKVPMKVDAGNVKFPNFIVASGSMHDFSKSGISDLIATGDVDGKMMAVASPVYNLTSSELINQVRLAMADGNVDRAEDALSVLQHSGDQASFKIAFAIYNEGLSGRVKTAMEECTCNLQRKVAHSKYIICGHTNLPIHKVYQDKNGDCQPLYRRNIAEAEGGSFMHSKVYFG